MKQKGENMILRDVAVIVALIVLTAFLDAVGSPFTYGVTLPLALLYGRHAEAST